MKRKMLSYVKRTGNATRKIHIQRKRKTTQKRNINKPIARKRK